MPTKFQLSILINKKVGPSAPRKGLLLPWEGLTHTNAHYCIVFCMSSMHTKFQLSILINKKLLKTGAFGPPQRAVSRSIDELTYMYTYLFTPYMRIKFQISILIIKNVGPSAPCQDHIAALGRAGGGLTHTYAYHCISFCMNIMHTKS